MRRRCVITSLLLVLMATAPAAAQGGGDSTKAAKEHYQRGSEAYAAGRYEEAVQDLQEAYRLSGEGVLLYNIAKCFEKLGDHDEAIRHLRDYLDLTTGLSDDDKAGVERTIKDLEQKRLEFLPELTIRSSPDGAKVYLDNKTRIIGQTPVKLRVESGSHKLYLERKGFEELKKTFEMPVGKPLVLDFELAPIEEFGQIQIVANIDGARIFLDGKNVGISPFRDTPKLKVGKHQVIIEKVGFHRWRSTITVAKGRTVLVDAIVQEIEKPSGAPSALGWTSAVFGGLGLLAGLGGYIWAEGAVPFTELRPLFNDSDDYNSATTLQSTGYIAGTTLLVVGITLLIYDAVRKPPPALETGPDSPSMTSPATPRGTAGSLPLPFTRPLQLPSLVAP